MKNKPTSEQAWVEQTLQSLEGVTRPAPSPWLYQQVRHRLDACRAAQLDVPDWGWTLKRLAFATALLVANVVTFAHRADFGQRAQTETPTQEYAYPTLSGNYY